MRETSLQTRCLSRLKQEGCYVLNIHGSSFGSRGTPDLLVCIDGKFVAFELKVGYNDLEPAQTKHRKRILQSGGLHFCIRNLGELEAALTTLRSDTHDLQEG